MTGKSLLEQIKEHGIDNPENGFVSRYRQTLNKKQETQIRKEFRESLLRRQRYCQITGTAIKQVIRASHIKPFDHCASYDESVDHANGLLLRSDLDYLFDGGYISFDQTYRIMFSNELRKICGSEWLKQMAILLPFEWLSSWNKGTSVCAIPPMPLPKKLTGQNDYLNRKWNREKIRAIKARAGFMDYHRRHIFRGEEIRLTPGNDNRSEP